MAETKPSHNSAATLASNEQTEKAKNPETLVDEENGVAGDDALSPQESAAPSEEPEYPGPAQVALIMTCILCAIFLMSLDRTIIATAIPRMTDEFDSIEDIGWYGSAFMVTTCCFQLLWGKVYTFYSPKYVFLALLGLFEVGSAICGAAPNSIAFIIGRAIAGMGSAGILSGAIVLMMSAVPLAKRPLYNGFFSAVLGTSSVVGPLLGGAFTSNVSWRWCFYINLPIGGVAMLIIFFALKPTPPTSRRFFSQSSQTKALIAHPPSGEIDDNRGWARTGLGHTVQMVFDADEAEAFRQNNPDCKETLELGNPFCDKVPPNKWVPEHLLPGFRAFAESWWADCAALSHGLYRALGEVLQIPDETYFSRMHSEDDCHMTWNFYPSMPLQALHSADAKRLNAHTDFGTLTIVFQDLVGGLEVYDGQRFRPVVPLPGAIVVNVGDMLEQQSNGRWKSALHRVVAPGQLMKPGSTQAQPAGTTAEVIDRYSLVHFGVPNPNELIETAPGCETPGEWKPNMDGDWGTLSARQWIQKRLAVEY